MKKIFVAIMAIALVGSMFLQSCCVPYTENNIDGVIKFDTTKVAPPINVDDSTSKQDSVEVLVVSSYNWSHVDTTGGFANIPTGIITEQSANNEAEPLLNINETAIVKQMLIAFQKKFNVRVTNYQTINIHNQKQLYIRVFFEGGKKDNPFRSNF